MHSTRRLLDRLLPALLMASSVSLLMAGLLSYAPSAFGEWETPEPTVASGDPLFSAPPSASDAPGATPTDPSASAPPTGAPTAGDPTAAIPTPSALPASGAPTLAPSFDPLATPGDVPTPPTPGTTPTATPGGSSTSRGVATRIRIPALNIDLPVVSGELVVRGNRDFYPLCDVAMYLTSFVQPGQLGSTYIYAHAQRGMFLPLLRASQKDNGASMVGALIEVYTSDNRLHLYELFRVKRHATDLSLATVPPGVHQLVLQTSEGYSGHVPKLQVAARPLSIVPASAAEANPPPRPRVCLPN